MPVQSLGESAIGVQIDGDNNTVTVYAGSAKLTLDQRHLRKLHDAPRKEIDLLLTDLRATEFVGRAADLDALTSWLNEPLPISVRCLTGAAGTGKTRLAIELCERANAKEWIAGFAREDELRRFYAAQNLAEWKWAKPTLAVVDNAAASSRILRDWLEVLARRIPGEGAPPLRILLLERYADPASAGWWVDLMRPGDLSGRNPSDLTSPQSPVELAGLVGIQDRHDLLSEVMRIAAKLRNIEPAPKPPPLGSDPAFDQRLADDTIDNEPLYLVMAGVVSVVEGASFAIARSRDELARRIAYAESKRVERIASNRGVEARFATHLVGCVTIQGGADLAQAKQIVEAERSAGGYGNGSVPAKEIVAMLADILPRSAGSQGVAPIRPDLIGEAFLLVEIPGSSDTMEEQLAIVERARLRAGDAVRETLIRAKQDFAHGDPTHVSSVWLAHVADQETKEFQARLSSGEMTPDQGVQTIWEIGVSMGHWLALTGFILPFIDKLSSAALGAFAAQRAVASIETGNYEYGLEFAEEILRRPAFPAWWRPELFNALGRCLFHLGRYPQAAEAYRSGIDAGGPNHPLVAQLYTNLGNAFLGDHHNNQRNIPAAIEALEKAVQLADDPRLRVEARASLSTVLIDSGNLPRAETVLNEAWSFAQDKRKVENKARMMVMRNLGIVHLLQNEVQLAIKELDAAVDYGTAHFGPCHPEMLSLYDCIFPLLAMALKPAELMERMLRALQTAQRICGVPSPALQKYVEIADFVTNIAVARSGVQAQVSKMQALIKDQAGRPVWDDATIAGIVALFGEQKGLAPS
ncbi:tetratricopeptide repeat protein [Methylocapsa polymorpha]|uniref:Tetratricopeptide repeat protein n=1 Tax=Methylocapsa polymorpha TaxID=3080828 RepID=A0ABZ0HUF1_9HYPH|nr:tetratricopeptide repeat protein [Methylocapsa sp. RX1]